MEEKLLVIKPCPCCGSELTAVDEVKVGRLWARATVMCRNRHCGFKLTKTGMNMLKVLENAINAWNDRAEA